MLNNRLYTDDKFRDFVLSNAYAVIFQGNTLKYITDRYSISKTDFTVLSAGYLLQKTSFIPQFSSGEVRKFMVGIWKNEVYNSVKRLSRRGFIQQGVSSSKRKRYAVTTKGIECIGSFTGFLSSTIQKFQEDNPGYYLVYI